MKIQSRKGTVMVEAAVIFPLVIAAVIAVICIAINLYSSLALQSALHLDLRKERGERSQTTFRMDPIRDFPSTTGLVGIRPVIRMETERSYHIHSLFQQSLSRKESGRCYMIDEAELVRALSLGGDDQ